MNNKDLKHLRTSLGYTQQEMADAINCSKNYYGKMERGVKPVADKYLDLLYALRSQLDNDKKLMTTGVVLNTDTYQQAYVDFKNELLTWLGINNTQMEKRERLLTDEINANNELIMDSVYSQLQLRTEAAKKINEMFGTNISVSFLNFKLQEEEEKKQEKQVENENVSRETMEGENE